MVTPRQPENGDSIELFIFVFALSEFPHPHGNSNATFCRLHVIFALQIYLTMSKAIHYVISLKPNKL